MAISTLSEVVARHRARQALPRGRAAQPRELRGVACDVIGLEIMDRTEARARYTPEGVVLLRAARDLLSKGGLPRG